MDSIPVPKPDFGTVPRPSTGTGGIVKDAAGLAYWLSPAVASATLVDSALLDKIDSAVDSAANAVTAYGMDTVPVPVYDPVLADLMNLYVNIQLSFGAKVGSELYKQENDPNGDGIINAQDAAYVKKKIMEYTGGK